MVVACIGATCWFTASTSFANPAAAFGRMFSNSFAGIVPEFVLAECAGAALGALLHRLLEPRLARSGHPDVIESSGEHLPRT